MIPIAVKDGETSDVRGKPPKRTRFLNIKDESSVNIKNNFIKSRENIIKLIEVFSYFNPISSKSVKYPDILIMLK